MNVRSLVPSARLGGLIFAVVALLAAAGGTAYAQIARLSTGNVNITQGPPFDASKPAFRGLYGAPGTKLVTRNLPSAYAQSGRTKRRTSVSYFGYMNDFQLADEESPARIDSISPRGTNTSSWRPQEALVPQTIDAMIQRMNAFAPASPNAGAKGVRAPMTMALLGGDQTDNQQLNETTWMRQLMEGGQALNPNSGIADYSVCTQAQRDALALRPPDEAARYTGLQDYGDYTPGNPDGNFWDPNQPAGAFGQFPVWAGLMDAAQKPFTPVGLRNGATPLPTYVTQGNHDAEVQGFVAANAASSAIATGCFKPYQRDPATNPSPYTVFGQAQGFVVPPDPSRRFLGPAETKRVFASGAQRDAHGFGFVDPAQNSASRGTASYYAFSPRKGLRFISLDTSSVGTSVRGGAEGNVDEPQYQWLRGELRRAKARKQYVVVFGHHPIRRLIAATPDEAAGACPAGSDLGCDADPRVSSPIHQRADIERLFNANANVVAYLSAHTHVNRIRPCATACAKGKGNWWSIETTSATDFPQQSRLVELMNNQDGTLSVLATPVDNAAPSTAPSPTGDVNAVNAFSPLQMASISRLLSANDPKQYRNPAGGSGDRNVELMVRDPFAGKGAGTCAGATHKVAGTKADRAVLRRKQSTQRRAYPSRALQTKKAKVLDRFCLVGGGYARVGYRKGRTVLALTSDRKTAVKRIKVGYRDRTVRSRLRGETSVKVGRTSFYLARASKARIVVAVSRGRVTQIGLADSGSTRDAKGAKRFLDTFF